MNFEPRLRISLSLPICLTISVAAIACSNAPAVAAHNEAGKPAKPSPSQAAAPAKEEQPEATRATILSHIRDAKIFDTEYPIHVNFENKEVTLTTLRHPKATDQDCKIDAVLAAKTLIDTYPKDVSRVKLVLSTSNSDVMQEIYVTTGDVKAYASGSISKDDLLSSLELKKAEQANAENDSAGVEPAEGAKTVVPGRMHSQRQMLAERIEKLKERGTGTGPFEEMLASIETNVPKYNDVSKQDLLSQINDLSKHLYEQEEAYRSAQHIANGNQGRFFGQQGPGGGKHEHGRLQDMQNGQGQPGMQGGPLMQKLQDRPRAGQNVQDLKNELNRIRIMRQSGDYAGAEAASKALGQKLGFPPRRGNGGP